LLYNKHMDAVYILGKGSLVQNAELRYSVRSLVQNMRDLDSVFIVGERVDFLPTALHIPAEDEYPKAWQNALYKTRLACANQQLSTEFLLMNDDFFLTKPFDGADFAYYAREHGNGGSSGRHDFSVHCPMRLNKEFYAAMPLSLDARGDFSPRSFYANYYRAPAKFGGDFVIRSGRRLKQFDEQIGDRGFFSISDGDMLDPDFKNWLAEKWPKRCRFE